MRLSEIEPINSRISEKRGADPKLTYGAAWLLVASERPDLIRAYNQAAARLPHNLDGTRVFAGAGSARPLGAFDRSIRMSDERIMIAMSDVGPRFSVRLGDTLKRVRRVPIAVLGKFQKGPQVFAITRETLSAMIANFRKQTAATVIDYEHASCEPEIAKGQPIPAAGWIEKLDDEPDSKGILWGTATFSERAAQMLNADEVRYFSPVIEYRRDKRTGVSQGATLVAGALTLRPFLDGMPAIAMSEGRR